MNKGTYIFTQLCQFLPRDYFEYLVKKYQGNKHVKSFTCWNHLMVLIWAQLSSRESLRDIITSLKFHKSKFHHMGFGKDVCRTTLSEANERRELKIFQLFAERVIELAQKKRVNVDDLFMDGIDYRVFAVDSTSIPLDINKYWWSTTQAGKGGLKLHVLLDLLTRIPIHNIITDNTVRDQGVMDLFPYETASFYIFDKAYVKLLSLSKIDDLGAFFIVRRKKKMYYEILEEFNCSDKSNGVLRDLKIKLSGRWAAARYKQPLRIVYYYSEEKNRVFEFFTNNFEMTPDKIAHLYRCRWQIEIFFKWVKQHLKIKRFYGMSENAVKIQIYVAIITYCMIAIVEKDYKIEIPTFDLLRILGISLFERKNLKDFFSEEKEYKNCQNDSFQNLNLF
ncbi:hypothetical protein M2138_000760 [Dysgonomonadaceae bacterium PH5-43]|nr:hypothetical protein [Dysgonomonadaceae bacterium PH5-43]